jgi:2-polyprenyl-6-methoxyphenol hydroxylase-like FAD-dependent oxidoreductase
VGRLLARQRCLGRMSRLSLLMSRARAASAASEAQRCRCSLQRRASTHAGDAGANTTPVAIVGAGPVGLTLALLLSKLGVRCTVLEKLAAPSAHPQAHFINVRSMEVFRSLAAGRGGAGSVADAVTALARPREEWSRFIYSAGPLLGGVRLGETQHFPPATLAAIARASPELPTHLPQHRLVPLLLEAIEQPSGAGAACDVRWGTPCGGITQHRGGGVTLSLGGAEGGLLRAERVVCCDGANSGSRAALGVPLTTMHPMEQQMVNVHFTSPELAARLRERGAAAMLYFVYAPDVIGVLIAHDLGARGEFALQLPSFGPPLSPEDLAVRLG